MNIENATIANVNLHTGPELAATVTIRIVNPTDATLAALLALANQPVTGTLTGATCDSDQAAEADLGGVAS